VLADLDAGDVGLDRLELALELGRGLRLEVVHVHVRRAARQVDHDGRLVRAALRARGGAGGPQAEHLAEGESGAERADRQEPAAADAVAEALAGAPECQHNYPPFWLRRATGDEVIVPKAGAGRQPNSRPDTASSLGLGQRVGFDRRTDFQSVRARRTD